MKHNLKNRPRFIYLEDVLNKNEYADFMRMLQKKYPTVFASWKKNADQKTEEWFKGLEGELRQKYDWWYQHTELDKQSGYQISQERTDLLSMFEEVLGIKAPKEGETDK